MYQCSSSYPDPFLHPLFSAFPSQLEAPPLLQPQCPPPATHHGLHHHFTASPPSAGDGGGFLGQAAPSSTFLQCSGASSTAVLSLHGHLLEPSHHLCNGGGGAVIGSPHLYDQHDCFDFPSAMQATNGLRPPPGGAAAESCTQEVIGGAGGAAAAAMTGGRVGRYTAEERKERIERYRSKRNHRNFEKKITYACRKTLADSRPRVRGRFARNGEAEPEPEPEGAGEVSSCNNSSTSQGGGGGEYCFGWRPAAAVDDEDEYGCDPAEYFWANFLDSTMSMNNPMIYS